MLLANAAVDHEPETQALSSNARDYWLEAMQEEYKALIQNKTWNLIERPSNQKVIDNKRVFKIKRNSDDTHTIKCYKARLVIRGFTQEYGIDYNETFSPVVRFTSI